MIAFDLCAQPARFAAIRSVGNAKRRYSGMIAFNHMLFSSGCGVDCRGTRMSQQIKLGLTLGFILGFAALAVVFSVLSGANEEVLAALAIGCAVSVFAIWLAGSQQPRQ
jgi:biotin transporter BioY